MRAGDPRRLGGPNNTPARVFENLLIVGSNTGEGYGSPPGDVRAFDVVTGKLVWTFHTIPRPGEFGYDTWPPDAWKYAGGANTWGEITRRHEERHRLLSHGLAHARSVWRRPRWRQPVRQLPARARRAHRQAALALPGRASRSVGLRSRRRAEAPHGPRSTTARRSTSSRRPARPDSSMCSSAPPASRCGRSRSGRFRRARFPAKSRRPRSRFPRSRRRSRVRSFRPEDVNPFMSAEEQERLRQAVRDAANDGLFTPSSHSAASHPVPRRVGRRELGQHRGRSGDRHAVRPKPRDAELSPHVGQPPPQPSGSVQGHASSRSRAYDVYTQICAACHGPGQTPMKSPAKLGADGFRKLVRQGKEQMPAFPEAALHVCAASTHSRRISCSLPVVESEQGDDDGRVRLPQNPNRYQGPATRYSGSFSAGWYTSNGLPAIGPPWTQLVAYDLNDGHDQVARAGWPGAGPRRTGHSEHRHRSSAKRSRGDRRWTGVRRRIRRIACCARTTGTPERCFGSTSSRRIPKGFPRSIEIGGRQYIAFAAGASWGTGTDPVWKNAFHRKPGRIEAQGYHVFALPSATLTGGTSSCARLHFSRADRGALAGSLCLPDAGAHRSHREAGVRARARRARARDMAHANARRRRPPDELELRHLAAAGRSTFLETVVRADAAVVDFVEGSSTQKVSPTLPKTWTPISRPRRSRPCAIGWVLWAPDVSHRVGSARSRRRSRQACRSPRRWARKPRRARVGLVARRTSTRLPTRSASTSPCWRHRASRAR